MLIPLHWLPVQFRIKYEFSLSHSFVHLINIFISHINRPLAICTIVMPWHVSKWIYGIVCSTLCDIHEKVTLNVNVCTVCPRFVICLFYFTSLHFTSLHFTLLYFTLLYFTLLYFTLLYFTLLYFTLLYFTLLYFTLLYFTLLYFTLLYFTLLYFTLLYFTLLYFTLRICNANCIIIGFIVI